MNLAKRLALAVLFGVLVVRLAFSAADILGDQTPLLWLLAPGAMVGSFIMSDRVHELRFLWITVVVNVVTYTLLAERMLWLWNNRVRRTEKKPLMRAK